MKKEPIDELIHNEEKNILLYLIGRRLLNLMVNLSSKDVEYIKKLSETHDIDEITKIYLKKDRHYTDDDLRNCMLAKSL